MTKNEARDVIEKLLQARLAGDVDAMLDHFGPSFSFGFPGATPPGSLARQSSDRAQLRSHLQDIVAEWRWKGYEIVSLIVDNDQAAVVVRHDLAHATTGTAAVAEVVDIVRFENGKIVGVREYTDTAQAARLAGVAA